MQKNITTSQLTREENLYRIFSENRLFTLCHWIILRALLDRDGMAITELMVHTQVSSANMTGLTDRLIERDLITRKEGSPDRRRKEMSLTDKGRELISQLSFSLDELSSMREWTKQVDLSFASLALATGLEKFGDFQIGSVGSRFGTSHSNSTTVVDGLESQGYAIRTDLEDRRQKSITLTQKGRKMVAGYRKMLRSQDADILPR